MKGDFRHCRLRSGTGRPAGTVQPATWQTVEPGQRALPGEVGAFLQPLNPEVVVWGQETLMRRLLKARELESVARTHRAVVVDEGWRSGSLSAEISARLTETLFYDLDAPVLRVCSAEVPMPYAHHLEQAALPQVPGIVAAVKEAVGRRG